MIQLTASGDAGDHVISLCVARNFSRQMGGMKITLNAVDTPRLQQPWIPRLPLVSGLTLSQPYIKEVVSGQDPGDKLNLVEFRRFHSRSNSLFHAQTCEANTQLIYKLPFDSSPWLTIPNPSSYSPGRVILCRTERYRSDHFPWREIVQYLGDRALLVGLPNEAKNFQQMFGYVEYCPTKTLLEVAQLVASSDLLIANQTSIANVAIGMGHPTIVEMWTLGSADVCLSRDDVQYSFDGTVQIEGKTLGKKQEVNPILVTAAMLNAKLPV